MPASLNPPDRQICRQGNAAEFPEVFRQPGSTLWEKNVPTFEERGLGRSRITLSLPEGGRYGFDEIHPFSLQFLNQLRP